MKIGDLITQWFELSRMTAERHRAGWGIILDIIMPHKDYNSMKRYEVLWPDGVISMIDERDALSYEEYTGSLVLDGLAKMIKSRQNEGG
jgi:hypothetical protein